MCARRKEPQGAMAAAGSPHSPARIVFNLIKHNMAAPPPPPPPRAAAAAASHGSLPKSICFKLRQSCVTAGLDANATAAMYPA